jgi:hypothetical protein
MCECQGAEKQFIGKTGRAAGLCNCIFPRCICEEARSSIFLPDLSYEGKESEDGTTLGGEEGLAGGV